MIKVVIEGDTDVRLEGNEIVITKKLFPWGKLAMLDCSNMTDEELAAIDAEIDKFEKEYRRECAYEKDK